MSLKYPITMDYVDSLSGRQFEIFTKELLNTLGYKTAHVTPATHDHGIDVLYMNSQNQLVGIQNKHYGMGTKIGYDAIKDTDAGIDYYNSDMGVVLTNCYFGKNALKSAHTGKLNIKCWDRDVLKELVDISNNILLSKLKRNNSKDKFIYREWTKSKTKCFKMINLSYSEMRLLNIISHSLRQYKHKTVFFKFKDLSKLVSDIKLPKDIPNCFQSSIKIHLLFNNVQYKCLTHNKFYLFQDININDDKRTVTLVLSDVFYHMIYKFNPNN